MSPEQLAGNRVDGRSDLFSLGVTLFQLTTGAVPFKGDSMANLMYMITHKKTPDPRLLRADLPDCVVSIIRKALVKEPDKRFQSGRQMAQAIKRCASKNGMETLS